MPAFSIILDKPPGELYLSMALTASSQGSQDYEKIAQAIIYLDAHLLEQPSLSDVAQAIHMSEFHFQRLFSRWVGISPKRFMQYVTKEHAKLLLTQSTDVLTTAHSVGLSGPGRLHDMFVTCEAMTPGEYKHRGSGLRIGYGFHPSPFGDCMVGATDRGICGLEFIQDGGQNKALSQFKSRWPAAEIVPDQAGTGEVVSDMLALFQGQSEPRVRIYLSGSNFQLKVWEALLEIPAGTVVSYQQVAIQIGIPGGNRAVGKAIANNPIPVLIPCHRVIRKNGDFGKYRFGKVRKKALLGWEMAKVDLMKPNQ